MVLCLFPDSNPKQSVAATLKKEQDINSDMTVAGKIIVTQWYSVSPRSLTAPFRNNHILLSVIQ